MHRDGAPPRLRRRGRTTQGEAGKLARVVEGLTTVAGAALLARARPAQPRGRDRGRRARPRRRAALRWSVFKAGFQSAADPKYTVIPQRQRAGTATHAG